MIHTVSVTEAKASLGELIAEAMKGHEIFIRSGRGEPSVVQLVRVAIPDPIPYIAPGALEVTDGQVALHETFPLADKDIFAR
jgi:antitoxin (DNA-binding transcriptional repressor) of toxin-antitoxin stability system